jgi:uncharacterized membrane protein
MGQASEQRARQLAQQDLPAQHPGRSLRGLAQIAAAWALGGVVGVVVSLAAPIQGAYGALIAWDAGAVAYVGWTWRANHRVDAEGTARTAVREDPTRSLTDVILLVAAVASLAAVVYAIADASSSSGAGKVLRLVLGVATIVASWFLVHTVFTTKYARRYYLGDDGGIDFNSDEPPVWTDFAYLAFTIGMTFQVSDTDIQTSALRRLALRHMLISYLFGAVIVAVTINLIASTAH